ncbi:MAG: hypothetical protein HY852_03540 [Bradyrhizobium sp.]|uniref:hypothetical protein n=1 Tax=Bradyrhizobium sp. TaxID=376 RepID=UPI0025BC1B69|nr:hypothetical protein [Bradyrhizobium sp.]MBI5260876.1 hypothetical protein [Bradyrhizobium sp.]
MSETRAALADVEYRLQVHRQNAANSPEAILKRKEGELAAARGELDRLNKVQPPDKVMLSAARGRIRDLEEYIKAMRQQMAAGSS